MLAWDGAGLASGLDGAVVAAPVDVGVTVPAGVGPRLGLGSHAAASSAAIVAATRRRGAIPDLRGEVIVRNPTVDADATP
jgi:hypothetical protein